MEVYPYHVQGTRGSNCGLIPPSTINNNTQYPQPTQKDDTNMTDIEVSQTASQSFF